MKKTQIKDALRNIWKQKVSFLSIIVIALLGVTTFLGIGYSASALRKNASTAYNRQNYRDIEVISTRLLTPDDLDCIRALDGVKDVEPVWQTAANAYIGDEKQVINIITATERINLVSTIEGRMPENASECAIEQRVAEEAGWKIGDEIEWAEMTDATGQFFLGADPFTIVGIVAHPDHASKTVPETPYMIVSADRFDRGNMGNCCMKAEIVIGKAADVDRFSKSYDETVTAVLQRIEQISGERIAIRDTQIKEQALELIEQAETALAENKEQLMTGTEARDTLLSIIVQAEQIVGGIEGMDAAVDSLRQFRQTIEAESSELDDAEAAIAEAEALIREQRGEVENLEPGRWFIFDGHGSASFVQLIIGSGNLKSLEMTFSLLFVLVGALVIYATISKMIDEQRTLVGTTKALGFFNREIFAKYLLFGLSATVLGAVFGILLARFVFEPFILKGYGAYYTYDTTAPTVTVGPTLIVLFAGIVLAVGAITFACYRLMRTPAIRLMQQAVPKGKKGSAKGGKRLLSLYSRLILLNIRTDLRRVIVTIVSAAGCCALIVIGFTLKAAVNGAVKNQYSSVVHYDAKVQYEYGEEIEEELIKSGADCVPLYDVYITYRITDNQMGELLCGDIDAIESMYRLNDWQTGGSIEPTDEGILIQRRLAEIDGLNIGSEFQITVGGTKTAKVRVAGIFENYIGRSMVMSTGYYASLFGAAPTPNSYLIRLNGADEDALRARLKTISGFTGYTPASADRAMFDSATSVVNSIVVLFIVLAAIMAGVVLTNLTNICIMQKKRELVVMRINGFTVKEVIGYVLRETIVTTIAGIVLGIALGSGIAYRIVRSMEQAFIRFDRSVSPLAWLYGALITVLFTVIINVIVLRKVKHLKLTDV